MAHGLAMAGGAVRATDDMAYPAGLPGSLRLEPRELHQLGHPADRTLAPESVRWIKTHDHRISTATTSEREAVAGVSLSQAIFVHERGDWPNKLARTICGGEWPGN